MVPIVGDGDDDDYDVIPHSYLHLLGDVMELVEFAWSLMMTMLLVVVVVAAVEVAEMFPVAVVMVATAKIRLSHRLENRNWLHYLPKRIQMGISYRAGNSNLGHQLGYHWLVFESGFVVMLPKLMLIEDCLVRVLVGCPGYRHYCRHRCCYPMKLMRIPLVGQPVEYPASTEHFRQYLLDTIADASPLVSFA